MKTILLWFALVVAVTTPAHGACFVQHIAMVSGVVSGTLYDFNGVVTKVKCTLAAGSGRQTGNLRFVFPAGCPLIGIVSATEIASRQIQKNSVFQKACIVTNADTADGWNFTSVISTTDTSTLVPTKEKGTMTSTGVGVSGSGIFVGKFSAKY